jgi:hypothetical protein
LRRYCARRSRQHRVSQHISLQPRVFCRNWQVSASLREPKASGVGKGNDRGGPHIYCRDSFPVPIFLAIELYPCVPAGHRYDPRGLSPRIWFVAVSPAEKVGRGRNASYRPPHRSGRAPLCIRLLPRVLDGETLVGEGWRIRGFGSQSSVSFVIRAQVRPPFWLRRLSDQRKRLVISARKAPNAAQLVGTAW